MTTTTTTMDGTELARWTRFAAKGGIGKCTAVQDCVAESPEDLMFLKDDEIIVLMQLSGQTGFYLGYCEGVVGRFRGDHVKLHGKLKRPVMTKRASASAVSVASSPPPSVTPSPRMPLSPLTTSSSATNTSSTPTRDRDSRALSDPFDLELDAPPKSKTSEEGGSNTNTQTNVDTNTTTNETTEGSRRRLTRGADDLPGLEMFLPRSRSGSRSRPTSSRGGPGSGNVNQADENEKNEKRDRRRTRIVTPQFSASASPGSDSLDIPPSPLAPPSPASQHQDDAQTGPKQQESKPASPEKQPTEPERKEDKVRISVEEDGQKENSRISMTPEPLQQESLADKDASSLYDGASARSSFYSTHSYRSSVFGGGNGLSAAASDAFARLSQVDSDDGGIGMGIGLSMLQDMADDEDDDTSTGMAQPAPPTPRSEEQKKEVNHQNDELERNKERYEDEEQDSDIDYDDDDDGSYWDGADIYDNYRYSRYSVMTKNSRRKSRFSVISRNSEAKVGPKKEPPAPLDAESRLRPDSTVTSTVSPPIPKDESQPKDESAEKKKHVPPPLNFVKSTPYSSRALLSPLPAYSPVSASNRSTAEFSVGGSDLHSPLLHTNFASPKSTSSRATSFGTDEADRQSLSPQAGLNMFSVSAVDAPGPSMSVSGSGVASALRQRLEHEQSAGTTPLASPAASKEAVPSSLETRREDSARPGREIVVDDDESVNVTVIPAEEGAASLQENKDQSNEYDHTRDSVQSGVSTVSSASVESTATDTSGASDVSGYMRKIEADLASVSAVSGSTQPLNARSALADAEGSSTSTPTPTLTEFDVGVTTQPLRVQDRSAARSTPSPLPSPVPTLTPDQGRQPQTQVSEPPLSPLPSPLPSPREQLAIPRQREPQQSQDAKSSQGAQLLRPEQALFLPHPNAPRPNPAVVSGERTSTYGMPPVHEPISQRAPASGPPAPSDMPGSSLEATLRAASAARVGPAGVPHRSTIFGKTVVDLASSDGPVAIVWSLSPFPPDPVSRTNSPAPSPRVPRRATTAGASPLSQSVHVGSNLPSPSPRDLNFPASAVGIPGPPASPVPVRSASAGIPPPAVIAAAASNQAPLRPSSSSVSDNNPSTSSPNSTTSTSNHNKNVNNNNGVLLRPNFSPRVGTARPRSRSFSDFAREVPVGSVVMEKRASEEGSTPSTVASVQSLRESVALPANDASAGNGAGAASSNANNATGSNGVNGHPLRQSATVNGSSPPKRSIHTPSPLSRPENNAVVATETPRASSFSMSNSNSSSKSSIPLSPLGRTFISSSQTQLPNSVEANTARSSAAETSSLGLASGRPVIPAVSRSMGVRQMASVDNFRTGPDRQDAQPLFAPSKSVLQPIRRNSGPSAGPSSAAISGPVTAVANSVPSATNQQNVTASSPSPVQRLRRLSSPSSKRHERTISQQSQTSSTTSEMRSVVSPPPGAVASSSTPSPVQRSNSIKSKLSLSHLRMRHTAKESSIDTQTPSPSTGPATPVFDFDNQPETVQVQDAEFEMIRPTIRRVSSEPMSDDSIIIPDEGPSLQRDSTTVESPVSGSGRSLLSPHPSTIADSVTEHQHMPPRKSTEEDAAAHRARELKWMSVISSVPPPQARKNRKVRKLVFEGVPSSVRYLVWSHLTDCKAKRIPGVYGQLGKRGRVAASQVIERDAARCFSNHPHLQDPKGPLVGLLQTYLTMVPDVQYQTSLALVAGHLLLQSPEEDAFWIFTSMMDMNLRAYFSPKSVQMDADALVLGRAVELTHPQLAKKLFVDMSIPPLEICRTWLPSLFATTLPQDYVNRIWDVYFCEGPPFLFRVALAILSCCRGAIESSSDRTAVLSYLSRPETMSLLPEDPEEFVNLAMAVKIKDEDIKKQRVKVETELRRRTQSAQRNSAPRLVSSISLPRAGPGPTGVPPL
ncbi:RabGAP/TBC [Sanghuangporus baumii]|uniref:RabGAP/TBC n=1 Tax=Sanghuangporus baumii TaxID=108892 RepID=A0A9Q5N725_SANBA|nr:RabGAP/TBC [Sanghuangporus baumii]